MCKLLWSELVPLLLMALFDHGGHAAARSVVMSAPQLPVNPCARCGVLATWDEADGRRHAVSDMHNKRRVKPSAPNL